MRRRDVLILAGTIVAPWPSAASAETPKVIAFVLPASPAAMAGPDPLMPLARAFVHALRDLGWVVGHNAFIERRSAQGRQDRAPVEQPTRFEMVVNARALGLTIPVSILLQADEVIE